jgi:hypothetical protein
VCSIKAENDVDVLSEDSLIDMKTDDADVPLTFSPGKHEPEVSFTFRLFLYLLFMWVECGFTAKII